MCVLMVRWIRITKAGLVSHFDDVYVCVLGLGLGLALFPMGFGFGGCGKCRTGQPQQDGGRGE